MQQIDLPMATDTPFKGVSQFAQQSCWNLMCIHDVIIEQCIAQEFQANKKHTESEVYVIGDCVYLLTQNMMLPKGRARKLLPQYIGPYYVIVGVVILHFH